MSDYAIGQALFNISSALNKTIMQASPAAPAESAARLALALTLEGMDFLLGHTQAYAPDNATSCEVSPTLPDGKITGNLYVIVSTPDGMAAQGLKAALMDTLLADWERPGLGIRQDWQELLGQLAPNAEGHVVRARVQQLLQGERGAPLLYRARLNSIMLSSKTPEERERREAALLQEFPQMGMRSVRATPDQPAQAVAQLLTQQPFRRG